MQVVRIPFTNFQFGEISPSLIARTDTQVYNNSAQKLTNFLIRAEGGVIKRSGTKWIHNFGTTVDDNVEQQVRLIPFIFSDDERYIIALSAGKIEFFIVGFDASGNVQANAVSNLSSTTLTSDTTGTSLNTRITEARLKQITYAQSGDVLFLAHNAFNTLKIVRTSLLTFQISPFSFDLKGDAKETYQPYYHFHQAGFTLTPSATSGNGITVIVKPPGTDRGAWSSGTGYEIGDHVTHSNQVYEVIADINPSNTAPNSDTTNFRAVTYFDDGSTNGGGYSNSLHVGLTLRYRKREIDITAVTSGSHATGNIADSLFAKLGINAIRTIKDSTTIEITMPLHNLSVGDSVTISETDTVAGISNSNLNGARSVTSVIDDNTFTVTAGASANASVDGGGAPRLTTTAPTTDWEEQSYSAIRGFPAAICFHEGRLWFGGTLAQPDGIWASQSGEFFNFNIGTALDNESIQLSSSVGELDQIKHLVSNRDLQVFTVTSEFIVPAFENTPVTPQNAMVRRQTPYGVADVKPFVFDGATLYVQRSGSVVREFIFSDTESAYVANAVSLISSHLIITPVQMTSLQAAIERPESYIFMVNSDGTMAVFNSNRSEKRAGWTQFTTKGFKNTTVNTANVTVETSASFHSVCTIDEKVFIIGKYDKGNGTKNLCLMEIDNNFNLDHAERKAISNSLNGVIPITSGHFNNGAVVDVIVGTSSTHYIGQFIVSNNEIDISSITKEPGFVEIGFKYPIELKTNPLDIQTANGPSTGMLRGLGRVILDLNNTLSVSINNRAIEILNVTDDFSLDKLAITGKKEVRLLGYSRDPQLTITQRAPLSIQINSVIAEVQI
tara:strand:- start:8497 stop:11013 length:2517 start_codon:yes stop_codon:yes gene_type:complete